MKKHYTLAAGILFMFSTLTSYAQWQATSGPLGAGHISSLAVKGGNIFAGTQNSSIYLSSDSGATWTASNTGISNSSDVKALAVDGANLFAGISDMSGTNV